MWAGSRKQFRFGDGRNVLIEGSVILHARVTDSKSSSGAEIRLRTDIAQGTFPLLISFPMSHLAKCVTDLEQLILIRGGRRYSFADF